jgi:antitoxin component of RelBE/YafQ-DinJ toxin-antitoxin module
MAFTARFKEELDRELVIKASQMGITKSALIKIILMKYVAEQKKKEA